MLSFRTSAIKFVSNGGEGHGNLRALSPTFKENIAPDLLASRTPLFTDIKENVRNCVEKSDETSGMTQHIVSEVVSGGAHQNLMVIIAIWGSASNTYEYSNIRGRQGHTMGKLEKLADLFDKKVKEPELLRDAPADVWSDLSWAEESRKLSHLAGKLHYKSGKMADAEKAENLKKAGNLLLMVADLLKDM